MTKNIEEAIEGLMQIPVSHEDYQVIRKTINILQSADIAGEKLGEKKKVNCSCVDPFEPNPEDVLCTCGARENQIYNQMHSIATAVVGKKNRRIEELESENQDGFKEFKICEEENSRLEKELQSLKSKLSKETVLEKLKDMDWDCFYRGDFYGCYYYRDSGEKKSQEFIGKTLLEALNKMWEFYNIDFSPSHNRRK